MELVLGNHYTVKVLRTIPAGAIVELDDQTTALIHISNISEKFVRDPINFVDVDGVYDAEAIEGKAHPIELSLKHLKLRPKRNIEQHDPTPRQHRPQSAPASDEYFDEQDYLVPRNQSRKKQNNRKKRYDEYDD